MLQVSVRDFIMLGSIFDQGVPMKTSIPICLMLLLILVPLTVDCQPPEEFTSHSAIEQALKEAGKDDVTIREFSRLNHLIQSAVTGNPARYWLSIR
jgi:hypothetical protein